MKRYGIVAAIVVVLALGVFAYPNAHRAFVYMREDAELRVHPSAETAFEYASLHFSAPKHPESYDVERAQKLYRKTIELDPDHPLAYLQLARTLFVTYHGAQALPLILVQIAKHPDASPSAYYMEALIYGYMSRYDEAAKAYQEFIRRVPDSAPAYNDLAWVLIKAGNPTDALSAAEKGLTYLPTSPWLLLTKTVALYDLGKYSDARDAAIKAVDASKIITRDQWALMYPGNDPDTIEKGIRSIQDAAVADLAKVEQALASSTPQTK